MTTAEEPTDPQVRVPFRFQVGGSLQAEQPSYIERAADQDLLNHLQQGEYCFVFNTRQMGKSSLRVQAMQQLSTSGVSCAVIDPQLRGTSATEDQWYAGTIRRLWVDLGLGATKEFSTWWQGPEVQPLSAVERFADFVETVLLPKQPGAIVIFVEEVDNLLSLGFDTDGFFGLIRSFYEHRSENSDLRRLCFCFLGVATPYDLIRGDHHSAFNIGHAVDLNGFSFNEARHFLTGLEGIVPEPEDTLRAVLSWTGGQPFLTQKLLQLVVTSAQPGHSEPLPASSVVEHIVRGHVIDNWESQDVPPHLRTIRDRLLRSDERERGQLLDMARQVQSANGLEADGSREQLKLRLTGLVVQRGGRLEIYNPTYAEIFTIDWIEQQLDALRPAIYREAFTAWKQAASEDRCSHLISGAALIQAQEWARTNRISGDDQEFIETSRASEQVARLAEKDNVMAQRDILHLQRLIAALVIGLLLLGSLSLFAWRNYRLANLRQLLASARTAQLSGDQLYGMVQAIAASSLSHPFPKERLAAEGLLIGALNGSGNREISLLKGHGDMVRSVAISRDGRRIASGSFDGTVRLWDASSGEPIGEPLRGHVGQVLSVAISRDGRRIISGGDDRTVRIWDASTGEQIRLLGGHVERVFSVAISSEGRRIISGSTDHTVRIWDASSGEPIGEPLRGHVGQVLSVAISRDGRRIISGGDDRTVRIWDASTGEQIRLLRGHTSWVYSVAISRDGHRIVSGSRDRTVMIWDVSSGEAIGEPLRGHGAALYSVAISRDGHRIVSASEDGAVKIWDADSGEAIGEPLRGHDAAVLSVAISHDGRRIVSGAGDRSLRIWGASSSAPLRGHKDWVNAVAISDDGRRIISGGDDRTVRIWDASTGEAIGEPLRGHNGRVLSVAMSRDGRRIISGGDDRTVRIWDASTGEQIRLLRGHEGIGGVTSVAISHDGRRIVSGGSDRTVRIWDVSSGEAILEPLKGHQGWVRSVAISDDGRRIISGGDDRTVRIWDASTGEQIRLLRGHDAAVYSVAISRDGGRIVSGSRDRTVRIWDATSGERIVEPLEGHKGSIYSVAISRDGHRIISGSTDRTVRIWDATSGESIGEPLRGHNGWVLSVAISSDGHRLISGSEDYTLQQWRAGDVQTLTGLACKQMEFHPILQAPESVFRIQDKIEVARSAFRICQRILGNRSQ